MSWLNIKKHWRFLLIVIGMMVLPYLLLARASNLLVLEGEEHGISLKAEGDIRTLRTEKLIAYRGLITDRSGELLAVSTPVTSIYADPKFLNKKELPELAKALGLSKAKLSERVELYKNKRFMYLAQQLAPHVAEKILKQRFSGVNGRTEYKRFYPAGEVAAHVVGVTGSDKGGVEGLELAFDSWLEGELGSKRVLKNRKQHTVKELGLIKAPVPGKDLQLTIDLKLQYLAYKELKHAIAKQGAKSGSLVTVDARTGEILAMVNQPSYNPNNLQGAAWDHMRNRAVTDVFEPGSTVKPLTIAAAMESGRYRSTDVINTSPGYLRVGSKTFMDPVNYGPMDLAKILKKSSQVGVSKIALEMQPSELQDMYFRAGLGQNSGIGFPGERAGTLPQRNRWSDVERANFAFGYGLNVNALQLAQAYLVLANDGALLPLSLIKQKQNVDAVQVIDRDVAREVRDMLRGVTEKGGTATRAAIADYPVAGKTGTAHKIDAKSGGYADDKYRALFAGFAPANDPRLVTVVVVDEPPAYGEYSGGKAAAPIFASVMEKSLRVISVTPEDRSAYLSSTSELFGGRG